MNARTFAGILAAVLAPSIGWAPSIAWAQPPAADSGPPTLNVLAGGVNTRGTDLYADLGVARQLGKVYKIEIVGETYGTQNRRPGLFNYIDGGSEHPGVTTIQVSSPADPRLQPFIKAIAMQKHATVMIDMDLGMLGKEKWETQTDKFAWIASSVAQERGKTMPQSENTIFTHSASTWGLPKIENIEAESGRKLFHHKYAAAPQTKQLSSDVTVLLAAGDLGSTGGLVQEAVLTTAGLSPAASRDIAHWTSTGHKVVRVSAEAFDATPSALTRHLPNNPFHAHSAAHMLGVRDRVVQVFIPDPPKVKPGEPPSPYLPSHTRTLQVANVSAGSVITMLEEQARAARREVELRRADAEFRRAVVRALEERGRAANADPGTGRSEREYRDAVLKALEERAQATNHDPAGRREHQVFREAVLKVLDERAKASNSNADLAKTVLQALDDRGATGPADADASRTNFDRLKEEMLKARPPEGGGIALRAAARLPVAPESLSGARWDERSNRIVLMVGGADRWRLPAMNPDIARAAYRSLFGPTPTDPEFSIGIDPRGGPPETVAPGFRPAFYIGPIRNTLLGLVLLKADVALGELAYGGSKQNAERGLDKLAGYHSLPEMYPAKYAEQPQQQYLLAVGERVVIQSLPSVLVDPGNGELAYVQAPELAVRFGRTTPVERAYAEIFGTWYDEILARVPELRDLAECARMVGVLKWLRENDVRFSPGSLRDASPREVVTPRQVAVRSSARLEDLAPKPPLVVYGEFGPTDIYDPTGGATRVQYKRGRVSGVVRADGRALTVHTDDLGGELAIAVEGIAATAFQRESDGNVTALDGVNIVSEEGKVRLDSDALTRFVPLSDARELIDPVARHFIRALHAPPDDAPPPSGSTAAGDEVTSSTVFWAAGICAALSAFFAVIVGWKRRRDVAPWSTLSRPG